FIPYSWQQSEWSCVSVGLMEYNAWCLAYTDTKLTAIMEKAENTTDVDPGVIPGDFGRTNASATTKNYDIFGNEGFGGYGNECFSVFYEVNIECSSAVAQMKNIWSYDTNDNQVSVPDLVPQNFQGNGIFSRKVFVGGLPPDMNADLISSFFEQFGANRVDWPHRKCTGGDIPPNG
ncbi:unnamed protein product, partial [Acanthocheilonema viteae]